MSLKPDYTSELSGSCEQSINLTPTESLGLGIKNKNFQSLFICFLMCKQI